MNNGTNADIVVSTTGFVFVAKSPENIGYDADGNMTKDGRWLLTWDAENRLTKAESLTSTPAASKRKVEWTYDYRGRRVRQTTSDGSSGSYVATEDLKFVGDGWRHIAELNATNNALVRSYAWGLDLSGSLDGAGGVGGLLMLNSAANGGHFYAYDGNGNTAALIKASDGTVSQLCEYETFGKIIRNTGLMAGENRFLFSTKRCDPTTDFELYEYRVRRTDLSWLSRDPIEEQGGVNLYGLVGNDPVGQFDTWGLAKGEGALWNALAAHYLFGGGKNLSLTDSIYSDAIKDELKEYENTILMQIQNTLCNKAKTGTSGTTHLYNNDATVEGSGSIRRLSQILNQGHLKVTVRWERKECKVCFTDVQVEFQDEIILKDWFRKHPEGYKTYGKDTALYLWTGFTPLTSVGMFREYQVQIKWSDPEEKKCYPCKK